MRFTGPRADRHARIIVGIDGSPNSLAALNRGAYLARAGGLSLDMVHVLTSRASHAAEAAGLEMLDMCVRFAGARGLGPAPEQVILRGDPARVLVQLSVTARRLVLGGSTSGSASGGQHDLLGGRVVPYCLAHSYCAVDVCADEREHGARVLAHSGGHRP